MTIAAHISINHNGNSLLLETLGRLALQHPEDHFIFFMEKEMLLPATLSKNITPVSIQPALKNSLLLHYWYLFKLPPLLKRYNAGIFLSEISIVSAKVIVPQLMMVTDDLLLQKKPGKLNKYGSYIKKHFATFASKAAHVGFTRAYVQEAYLQQYPALQNKTTIINAGISEAYFPLTDEAKEQQLLKITGGTEYILCNCAGLSESEMVSVLKAFSIFKKRLKSGLHLVMLLQEGQQTVKDFHNYKYRDAVHFIPFASNAQAALLTGSAFEVLYPAQGNGIEDTGLEILKTNVPLVMADTAGNRKLYADAILYAEQNEKSLAENMMLLYKDEALKQELKRKGKQLAAAHNWESSANDLWQTILNHSQV